jgi:hypothetical protein
VRALPRILAGLESVVAGLPNLLLLALVDLVDEGSVLRLLIGK